MKDKLYKLFDGTNASAEIHYNPHKNNYQSVEEYFINLRKVNEDVDNDISVNVSNRMIKTDTIINIVAYTDTPVGFYEVYHYDFEMALDEILKEIE